MCDVAKPSRAYRSDSPWNWGCNHRLVSNQMDNASNHLPAVTGGETELVRKKAFDLRPEFPRGFSQIFPQSHFQHSSAACPHQVKSVLKKFGKHSFSKFHDAITQLQRANGDLAGFDDLHHALLRCGITKIRRFWGSRGWFRVLDPKLRLQKTGLRWQAADTQKAVGLIDGSKAQPLLCENQSKWSTTEDKTTPIIRGAIPLKAASS